VQSDEQADQPQDDTDGNRNEHAAAHGHELIGGDQMLQGQRKRFCRLVGAHRVSARNALLLLPEGNLTAFCIIIGNFCEQADKRNHTSINSSDRDQRNRS
jgi:hypothetical protein